MKQWKWMAHCVWEANRKVFRYSRTDRFEPRREIVHLQGTRDRAAAERRDEQDTANRRSRTISRSWTSSPTSVIRAMFQQVVSADESTLHVFARTRSSETPDYFYRRRINAGRWTPGEGAEINANLLVTSVFNRRLHLFWPQLIEKANPPTSTSTPNAGQSNTSIPQPDSFVEVRLFRSEQKAGKWTPKRLSDKFVVVGTNEAGARGMALRVVHAPQLSVQLFEGGSQALAPTNRFAFDVIGSQIEKVWGPDVIDAESVSEVTSGGTTTRKVDNSLQAWRIRLSPGSQIVNG